MTAIYNKTNNTITDYHGVPREIIRGPMLVNSGSCVDFAVGPVDEYGRCDIITVYDYIEEV